MNEPLGISDFKKTDNSSTHMPILLYFYGKIKFYLRLIYYEVYK
jgi:hypothetical protein